MMFPHSENRDNSLSINNGGLRGDNLKTILQSVAGDMGFEYHSLVGIVALYTQIDNSKINNPLLSFNFGKIKPAETYTSLEFQVLSGVQKMHPVNFEDDNGKDYKPYLEKLIACFNKRIESYEQKDIGAVTETFK